VTKATYNPAVFDVADEAQAKSIILTPEGSTTEERWRVETSYLIKLIAETIKLRPGMTLLDYGCGIGRMAKELIDRHDCRVVGLDISSSMRALAATYVNSDRFCACSPAMLAALVAGGLRFDGAISIWVLQHCLRPADDIGMLRHALKPDAPLFIVNNLHRAVPTIEQGWASDGLDIKGMLGAQFVLQREGRIPQSVSSQIIAELTFWATFLNRQPS
jgi:cyclopropane fatty-acyl-phospholipid synthase-like methyltransferase